MSWVAMPALLGYVFTAWFCEILSAFHTSKKLVCTFCVSELLQFRGNVTGEFWKSWRGITLMKKTSLVLLR